MTCIEDDKFTRQLQIRGNHEQLTGPVSLSQFDTNIRYANTGPSGHTACILSPSSAYERHFSVSPQRNSTVAFDLAGRVWLLFYVQFQWQSHNREAIIKWHRSQVIQTAYKCNLSPVRLLAHYRACKQHRYFMLISLVV